MSTYRSVRIFVPALALAAYLLASGAPAAEPFEHPVMRVRKLAAPPTIDGTIGAEEWARAAAFTGVTAEGSVGGHGSLVPRIQQVQWFLGYDDRYLYLAMRSPHPKGTYPVARVKEDDLVMGHAAVLFEDHVEVQILTHGRRDLASTQGNGFYKIMANPKGARVDQFFFNGTPGTELAWSMGGPVKCRVTPDTWELEMAVELGRMDLESLDGRDLVIQLVRTDSCTGMYFAGWVGAPWLAWSRFARVDFSPDTPVVRFLQLGELGAGELDAVVEVVGGAAPAEVEVELTVENAGGGTIYRKAETAQVGADGTARMTFREDGLPISVVEMGNARQRNRFEIRATAEVGGETLLLYRNRSPFMQFDEAFRTQFLDKWIAGRPQSGEWEYRVAYLPYSDKLEASVDLDFFGVPAAITRATAYRVSVHAAGSDAALAEGRGTIRDLVGPAVLIDLPELEEGDYAARFELLGPDGGVIDRKTAAFTRKVYPWEHHRLGTSDEVIRPFLPLEVASGNSVPVAGGSHYIGRTVRDGIRMWGRVYDVGENGLLRQVYTAPPSGNVGGAEALLAAPMRFEVTRAGATAADKGAGRAFGEVAMHRVEVSGSSAAGGVSFETASFVEYDGWQEFTVKVRGDGPVDALDLVVDLDQREDFPVDTLYVQRLGDGRNGNFFGEIPDAPGVHFESTSLLEVTGKKTDWKSFVPKTYVGNGDRGLWFFAWSAHDWALADGEPAVRVERLENGDVRLRVRLLAGGVELDGERELTFAVQAAPVKPNHPRYRTFSEEKRVAHDTRGYRYYGRSVDGFVNTSGEDLEALRKFMLYGMRYQGEEQRTGKKNYNWWKYGPAIGHGAKPLMYGSGQLMGMGAEEFQTFGGEWLGRSNWTPNRGAASDHGRWNYQGTVQWLDDEQLSVTGVNWTQSMIDFFLWHHKPLLEKAGFHGTWWDNASVGTVREFDPRTGRMEEVWLLYPRRQLVKRLNVLGWELMRAPMWAANMHSDLGWAQVFWMVENDWYADGRDMTTLDQWPLAQFRAMARTKSTMQVALPWLRGFAGSTPEHARAVRRSVDAMLLSHDIHPSTLSFYATQGEEFLAARRALARLRGLVNLTDTQALPLRGLLANGPDGRESRRRRRGVGLHEPEPAHGRRGPVQHERRGARPGGHAPGRRPDAPGQGCGPGLVARLRPRDGAGPQDHDGRRRVRPRGRAARRPARLPPGRDRDAVDRPRARGAGAGAPPRPPRGGRVGREARAGGETRHPMTDPSSFRKQALRITNVIVHGDT